MSISTFSSLCELLSNLGTKQVRLMGGEPTFHKDFSVFCETAQKTFPRVVVLTNAMNDHISRFCPREQDRIVYNLNAMPMSEGLSLERLLLDKPGLRAFSIVVSRNADVRDLVSKIVQLAKIDEIRHRFLFDLSADLTEDVFRVRNRYDCALHTIFQTCLSLGLNLCYDKPGELVALYPKCLEIEFDGGPGHAPKKMCSRRFPDYIDASGTWRFCHAFPVPVASVFLDGKPNNWAYVCSKTIEILAERIAITANRCSGCPSHGTDCDGSCFALTEQLGYRELFKKHSLEIRLSGLQK